MAKAQVRVLPSARNTVMVVDDQSTGRAILEQVVRSLDERVAVEGFARPVDAVVWATRHVSDLVLVDVPPNDPPLRIPAGLASDLGLFERALDELNRGLDTLA